MDFRFPEITELWRAFAFEMTCRHNLSNLPEEILIRMPSHYLIHSYWRETEFKAPDNDSDQKQTWLVRQNEPHRDKTNKMACAPSENSDQPGHPPSLIRVFALRLKKAWVLGYLSSAQWRLWSDWADAQADLSLRWAHMPFCWFCHDAAQICLQWFKGLYWECKHFRIRPRKGQYSVYDKASHRLINSSILPVPTTRTKGVIVFRSGIVP